MEMTVQEMEMERKVKAPHFMREEIQSNAVTSGF